MFSSHIERKPPKNVLPVSSLNRRMGDYTLENDKNVKLYVED